MANTSGLHIVRQRLKAGDRWYVYSRRGGTLIHTQDGHKPVITDALLAKAANANGFVPRDGLDRVLDAYRASPEFAKLADKTKEDYRHRLNQISGRLGRVPTRLLAHPDFRAEVMKWRAEMSATPRAADRVTGMLHTVLRWAKVNGMVTGENPAADIPKLHRVNRADLIWEDRHWQAIEAKDEMGEPKVPGHIRRVLTLGVLTGLRIGDLLRLAWEDLEDGYLLVRTQKTGSDAVIPLYPDLERFLTGPGRGVILRTSNGTPWTPDGWKSSWRNHKPAGFDRKVHDLRGTFATRLMIAGFADSEIALVMGWNPVRVAAIRMRYVDRSRVARALAARLGVKTPVKDRGAD